MVISYHDSWGKLVIIMAGWGSAIKNTILFAITALPGIYLYSYLKVYTNLLSEYYLSNGNFNIHGDVVLFNAIVFLVLIIGVGPMFFKFFSTTVEDGMIEF